MQSAGRRRIVAIVGAYVALGLAAQLILTLTPYPLFRTVTPEERLVGLAVDAAWIVALVVLLVRQPTSSLWKVILLWEAAGNLFALWYLPIEPRWLLEIPLFLVGDLWAAVFIHLVLAYPSGRLADRVDRVFGNGVVNGIGQQFANHVASDLALVASADH